MDDIDYRICDYLFFSDKVFSIDCLERDNKMEGKIIELGKLDYLLRIKYFSGTHSLDDGTKSPDYDRLLTPLVKVLRRVRSYARSKKVSLEEAQTNLRQQHEYEITSKTFAEDNGIDAMRHNYFPLELTVVKEREFKALVVYYDGQCIRLLYRLLWKGKKVLVPGIRCQSSNRNDSFIVQPSFQSLYGLQELDCRPEASVILTDSIEIAHRCNFELFKTDNIDYIWCSWYDDGSDGAPQLDAIDLSPLKNRKIYYLVKAHSGIDESKAIKRAIDYSQVFKNKDLKNVKYVVWLKGEINYYNRHPQAPVEPRVFEKDDFIKLFSENEDKYPDSPKKLRNFYEERGRQRQLLTPLLNERTCTLIHGPSDCGTSWFSMSLAMCLVKGYQFIDGWAPRLGADVLYVNGMLSSEAMQERFEYLNKSIGSKKNISTNAQNLSWASPNEILSTNESELDWLYRKTTEVFNLNNNLMNPRVLIIDSILELLTLGDPKAACLQFNYFVNFLKSHNIALIIATSTNLDNTIYELCQQPIQTLLQAHFTKKNNSMFSLDTLKNRVRFNNEIQLNSRKSKEASKSIISVRIKKGFKLPKGTQEKFILELSIRQDSVKWYLQGQKSPVFEKLEQVYKYRIQSEALTGREIANEMNITESLVKKHVGQIKNRLAIRDPLKKEYFIVGVDDEGNLIPHYLKNYKPVNQKSGVEQDRGAGGYFIIGKGSSNLPVRHNISNYQPPCMERDSTK